MRRDSIDIPAATMWPMVLAFGITMVVASLVTSEAIAWLGAIVAVAGAVGWFREVLPVERHKEVKLQPEAPSVTSPRREVDRLSFAQDLQRAWLPIETYPISAGIKGGLAGSVVMAVIAMCYGVLSGTGAWYPVNLLAAGFFPASITASTSEIAQFRMSVLLIAVPIHLTTSLLVGLLYGAMLPISPRRPILLGGIIAPVLWSGLIHTILGSVNPVLSQHIDWRWFVMSQVGFGVVAGLVVAGHSRIGTEQQISFAARLGLETTGESRMNPKDDR